MELLGFFSIFPPLMGFILAGLVNKSLPDRFSQLVTCNLMGIASLASLALFHQTVLKEVGETHHLLTWLHVGDLIVEWGMKLDILSATMIVIVNLISLLVHVYSIGYMSQDPHVPRFMSYLSLFTWSMLMLVSAPNLLQLFFGWEGVGLTSYLLIGFWYHKPSANAAAMKAFIVNRIGDMGFVLGIAAIFHLFNTIQLDALFVAFTNPVRPVLNFWGWQADGYTVAGLLFFFGAMGKSAQLGLHTWLADAMEGPTPVSALIHAATMVTAGVFLLVRLSPLYELAPIVREIICVVGALTAFFAATVALTQNDIKRIIAYSTCSQLGYMFFAVGCSAYAAAIFHLVTHAFFKALLFLGAGAVIHAMSDEQDIRRMGGLWIHIPLTYTMMWIGSLALAGIPWFSGYYSKDSILEAAFASTNSFGQFAFVVGVVVAGLTAFYSWRLILLAFHGKSHTDERVMARIHEAPLSMQVPLIMLAIGAIFSGVVGYNSFIGSEATSFWGATLKLFENPLEHIDDMPLIVKMAGGIAAGLGIFTAYYFYWLRPQLPEILTTRFTIFYRFSFHKWYFDEVFERVFVKPLLAIGLTLWRRGDRGMIDRFGPDGIAFVSSAAARFMGRLQTGYVYHYAFAMLAGVVLLLSYYLLKFRGLG